MDDTTIIKWVVAFVASEIFEHILFFLAGLIFGGLLAMFGTLMFGRNYKKRILTLEEKVEKIERKIDNLQESICKLTAIVENLQKPVEKIETKELLVNPDEEAWKLTPGHGELAATVMHAQSTPDDACRVYQVFDAAEPKTNAEYGYAAWAEWLTRSGDLEDEGYDLGQRLDDLGIELADVLEIQDS